MHKSKIKIAIADDHYLCRIGFASMLDYQIHDLVAEAKGGNEIIEVVRNIQLDVLFIDIEMPDIDGFTVTKILSEKYPTISIIALSIYNNSFHIQKMIEAGALGFICKTASKEEVFDAIDMAYEHKEYYCKVISEKIKESKINKSSDLTNSQFLTETELRVIKYLCEEYSSEQISKILYLSKRTIDGIRLRIQKKLNVHSTTGIVKYSITNGIYKV